MVTSYMNDGVVLEKLAAFNDDVLNTTLFMNKGESPLTKPILVKGNLLMPLLEALVHASGDEGLSAGGRVVSLSNKTAGPFGGTSPTMLCEVRALLPGQEARAHRHTMAVLQYVLEGSGTSTIDGETYQWEQGDLVVYPAWCTHSFQNTTQRPAYFFSVMDAPLVEAIGQLKVRPPLQEQEQRSQRQEGLPDKRRYRDFETVQECIRALEDEKLGVFTYLDSVQPPHRVEPMVIRWKNVRPLLDALLELPVQEDPRAGRVIGVYNKTAGESRGTTPALMAGFQVVPPGRRGLPHRHSVTAIQYIIEGEGSSVIEGQTYCWQTGDIIVTPGGCAHDLSNDSEINPAYILGITDLPLMKFLGLLSIEELSVESERGERC